MCFLPYKSLQHPGNVAACGFGFRHVWEDKMADRVNGNAAQYFVDRNAKGDVANKAAFVNPTALSAA